MLLDQPPLVVAVLEGHQSQSELLDGLKGLDPQQLFFERPDEALGYTVALGLPDKCWTRADPKESSSAWKCRLVY